MDHIRPSLSNSLAIQARVFNALAIRFIMTRYGRDNLGFLWIIIEPMLLCVGVMAVWSLMQSPYKHGVALIVFVLTGYMPLTLQRHTSSACVFILRSSKSIIVHRNITYFDNLLSRLGMEFIAVTFATVVIFTALFMFRLIDPIYDYRLVLIGWFMMFCLSSGFGCILAGLSASSELIEKFIQPINYLMLPLSGCFFMVSWFPEKVQDVVLYMPFVHAFEMIRAGMLGPSIPSHFSIAYGYGCGFVMIAIGFLLVERSRDNVL